MNCFLDRKAALFDQPPTSFGTLLMPEANRLLCRVDRRAYILTTPSRTQTPDFVQQRQRTTWVDLAHKVQPAGCKRQAPPWNQTLQARVQPRTRAPRRIIAGLLPASAGG
jgi:hypothetical protein